MGKATIAKDIGNNLGNLNLDWQLGILMYIFIVVKWNYIGKFIDFIKIWIVPHLALKLSLLIYFRKFQQKPSKYHKRLSKFS